LGGVIPSKVTRKGYIVIDFSNVHHFCGSVHLFSVSVHQSQLAHCPLVIVTPLSGGVKGGFGKGFIRGIGPGLADRIMARMRGEETDGYSEGTKDWLTSHEFRMLNQEKYIGRSRSIDIGSEDTDKLWDAYYRLVDNGLIEEIEDLRLFWSKGESVSKAGQSSCLMRTVIMNRGFLDDRVSKEVLDYCLLHELANILIPFGIDNVERNREVNEIADGFAGAETAKQWLDQVMMEV